MKNRRFPYGYEMQNGVIVTHPKESDMVKQIFDQYLNGENLKNIAERLTENQIEFLPGEYNWNKSRIKRIIEDERYIGGDNYPAIIDKDTFQRANVEKNNRIRNINPVITAEKKLLTNKVICSNCGRRLFHDTDSRLKNSEKWFCKNEECRFSVYMTVSGFVLKPLLAILILTDPLAVLFALLGGFYPCHGATLAAEGSEHAGAEGVRDRSGLSEDLDHFQREGDQRDGYDHEDHVHRADLLCCFVCFCFCPATLHSAPPELQLAAFLCSHSDHLVLSGRRFTSSMRVSRSPFPQSP